MVGEGVRILAQKRGEEGGLHINLIPYVNLKKKLLHEKVFEGEAKLENMFKKWRTFYSYIFFKQKEIIIKI